MLRSLCSFEAIQDLGEEERVNLVQEINNDALMMMYRQMVTPKNKADIIKAERNLEQVKKLIGHGSLSNNLRESTSRVKSQKG